MSSAAKIRTTEHAKRQGTPAIGGHPDVVAETRRERSVLRRFIHRDDFVEVRAAIRAVADEGQRYSHKQMRNMRGTVARHEPGQAHELRCKIARDVALERHAISDPKAVEHGIQNQRIFDRFSGCLRFLDPQTRRLERRLCFRRCMALGMDERVRKVDLKLDLFVSVAFVRGSSASSASARESCCRGLDQCRARQRASPCLGPKTRGFIEQARLRCVSCKQLRPAVGDLYELSLKRFSDTRMNCPTLVAQQGPIGGVLHQRMIELVDRIRRHALTKQQAGGDQPLEADSSFLLRFAGHGGEQGVRELPADRCPDLRQCLAEPSRSRRDIRDACKDSGTAIAGDGTAATTRRAC